MFLTNVANDIPLSIWYDWRDDGDDPKEAEHRFGIVRRKPTGDARQPFEPKPAYTTMKVMSEELKGMRFSKELRWAGAWCGNTEKPFSHLYAGEKGERLVEWVAWPSSAQFVPFGDLDVSVTSTDPSALAGTSVLNSLPSEFPGICRSNNPTGRWRLLSAWPSLALDYYAENDRALLEIPRSMRNPLEKDAYRWRGESEKDPNAKVERIPSGTEVTWRASGKPKWGVDVSEKQTDPAWLRDDPPLSIDAKPSSAFQSAQIVTIHPIRVHCDPLSNGSVMLHVSNPSKLEMEIRAVLISPASQDGKPVEPPKETVHFKLSRETADVVQRVNWPHSGIIPYAMSLVALPSEKPIVFVRVDHAIHTGVLDQADAVRVFPDGDAAVASMQSLADGQPAEGASVSGTPSVGLRYRFGAGWKFVRIEPKDAAARKIEGTPKAFGIWVHGDGQGGTPCIRVRDETGQTHQGRGEPVSWKGWRYVTFPLRPSADSGQTMIPLPDAGAEQRVTWSHWGGANDGVVHTPIEWDSLFLLDGNRRAMEGEIFLSAPTLVY
jgi:hypothetical protein